MMSNNTAFVISIVFTTLSIAAVKIVEYIYGCGGGL